VKTRASSFSVSSRRGIALLLTLVILVLIAIFMTEFSFNTTLETRGIRNFQAAFETRNAVKSMFKAMLKGLEEEESLFFKNYLKLLVELAPNPNNRPYSLLNPPPPSPLGAGLLPDFKDVNFYTPYVRPIDHLFNLNRIQSRSLTLGSETPPDFRTRNEFVNVLKTLKLSPPSASPDDKPQTYSLDRSEILPLYASIFDWMDKDEKVYMSAVQGMIGAEQSTYMGSSTELFVKNRRLDRLSELMLIQGIAESGIPLESTQGSSWKQNFTVYPVGSFTGGAEDDVNILPRINVNLANEQEIIQFLERYNQDVLPVDSRNNTEHFFERKEDIAAVLTENEPLDGETLYKNDAEIRRALEDDARTQTLPPISKKIFVPYSFWYEIWLVAEIEGVRSEVRAIVEVDRKPDGSIVKINKQPHIIIHDFVLK